MFLKTWLSPPASCKCGHLTVTMQITDSLCIWWNVKTPLVGNGHIYYEYVRLYSKMLPQREPCLLWQLSSSSFPAKNLYELIWTLDSDPPVRPLIGDDRVLFSEKLSFFGRNPIHVIFFEDKGGWIWNMAGSCYSQFDAQLKWLNDRQVRVVVAVVITARTSILYLS